MSPENITNKQSRADHNELERRVFVFMCWQESRTWSRALQAHLTLGVVVILTVGQNTSWGCVMLCVNSCRVWTWTAWCQTSEPVCSHELELGSKTETTEETVQHSSARVCITHRETEEIKFTFWRDRMGNEKKRFYLYFHHMVWSHSR